MRLRNCFASIRGRLRSGRNVPRVACWAIAALAVAGLATTPCMAGPMTYSFVNYPSLQGGASGGTYTISGTITTDGAALLTTADIVSWSLTASNPVPGNPTLTLSSSDPGAFANIFWTAGGYQPHENSSGIFLPTGSGGQSRLNLGNANASYNFGSYGIPGTNPGLWATQGETSTNEYWHGSMQTTGDVQYASAVPEPASLALALLGAGVVSGARLARRRRRQTSIVD